MVKRIVIFLLSSFIFISSPALLLAEEGQSLKSRIEQGSVYVKQTVKTNIVNKVISSDDREVRFEKITDEKKRLTVERIEENLAKMNSNAVEHFNKIIERLEKVLEKLKERGGNTVEAEALLTEAKTAVDIQSSKSYQIVIEDNEKLGEEVSKVVKQLRTDLKEVKEKVKAAKEAVKDVFETIREEKENE